MISNKTIDSFKKFVPRQVRGFLTKKKSFVEYKRYNREQNNPYFNEPDEVIYPDSKYKIGIFREFYQYHKSYIKACRDLEVSYKIINLYDVDWQEQVKKSGCDAFLIWPSIGTTVWKDMVDDRIRNLSEELKQTVFPSTKEVWLYENKNRIQDWVRANDLPQPQTLLFYELDDALKFANKCKLPVICKSNIGATAAGVHIFRDREKLKKFINKAFKRGFVPIGYHPLDKQWGRIYIQEFLDDVEEWRMIRIADSYFGYRKEKVGDFHSGSGKWSWLDPGEELLNFLKEVTDKGDFRSMDVDVFRDKKGNFYINELQTVFGATTPKEMLKINGVEGRYLFKDNKWVFEPGEFSKNECSNLRVQYLIDLLDKQIQ